ncbi:MAG TPA: protein kinase [Polyangiaceae bacterium]|nr:protein kinase [Polyangiaceae bacterium]
MALSRDVLGLDPESVGGLTAKSSFAKALTQKCVESDAVVALCDALAASRDDLDPRVFALRSHGTASTGDLELGDEFGPFLILRRLGKGRLGTVYLARNDGVDMRLKVLRREATYDRVALQRFLAASRLVGTVDAPGLPGAVLAGAIDGRYYVAHRSVEGQTLATRIAKTSAMHVDEARGVIQGILEALSALHEHRLVHGSLRLENILVGTADDGSDRVVLLDAGTYHLSVPAPPANGRTDRLAALGSPKTLSPEQIEGRLPDAKSDLYSFGAVLFEVLTGRPVFEARSAAEALLAHLTREPSLPSIVAPPGWVGADTDDCITQLLNKDPEGRPADAASLVAVIDALGSEGPASGARIEEEEVEARIRELLQNPTDAMAEDALASAVREGGDAARIAESLRLAADMVSPDEGPEELAASRRLLTRAARLYATTLKDPAAAEPLYARLADIDPDDQETAATLERLRRKLGKHEEIIETLLARAEAEEDSLAKAALWDQIGRLYAVEMEDTEQALVAFTQAFCEDPTTPSYAEEVERLATRHPESWNDVLQSCMDAQAQMEGPWKHALLLRMARWYDQKIARPDLAVPCYTMVLGTDPTNDAALEGISAIYRKAQQWGELTQALLVRADSPMIAGALARDLRVEAAEVLETKLGNPPAALSLYERVLAEDPSHEKACDALVRLYEAAGDFPKYVAVLETRARALSGEERLGALFRIAEGTELYVKDIPEAIRRYKDVIQENPKHLDALHGLDRCYSQTGRFKDLIQNLEMQIAAAATPRQKIQLWERVAAVWDEEFYDHAKAAAAWENVLDLDAEHDAALTNLVRHYRALERWNDVVVIYERHLELLGKDRPRLIEKGLGLGKVLAEGLRVPERAISVYERVVSLDPTNSEALEALAALRASTGETHGAVQAIEALAKKAGSPAERAEQFIRAAQVLEAQGDMDGAIERYKMAVDANPKDRAAALILRAAYVARGDVSAAAELLEQEIKLTESEAARSKLQGEMAALCHDKLHNDRRAESWAKLALDVDPTNLDALRVMGDIAFEANHFVEAGRYYEQVANRTDALPPADAIRVLSAYADSLVKSGNGKKAAEIAERLLGMGREDVAILGRVSEILFEHGAPERAFEVHWDLSHRTKEAPDDERARVLYRLGESARRAGDVNAALRPLEEASELDPTSAKALKSLAQVHGARGNWDIAIRTMYRQLENESGEDRIQLLLDIGDLAAEKLKDPNYAAKSYLTALGEKPNDRKILGKLMQLYSAEKDWDRLVKVVLKLADFVDDDKQKAKYLYTAGRIAWKEMGDAKLGSQILARALEVDPENVDVATDGVEVHALAGNAEGLKEALKRQVKIASDAQDTEQMLRSLQALAELYLRHFKRLDQAIAVYEAAQEVDPENAERKEILARLYAADTANYLDKAIAAQQEIIDRDPFRPDAHKALRKLNTEAHRPDAAWCACQALYVLGQADPEEERFYQRMRSEEGISPKSRLTEPDFHAFLMHKHAEPLLTALFTVIQPAVMAVRSKPLPQLGYGPELLIDPQRGQFASAQVIPFVADILGMPCPPLFQNPNDLGELSFIHAQHPSVVIGTSVIGVALPIQTIAFMAARHLTYYRSGVYVRQLVPTTTGLKAWLFAAMRLMAPQFPIPPDLHGAVSEAIVALDRVITGQQRDHLARVVSKLVQESAALDLKKWVAGVDLTADRAGLLLSDDLATAVDVIRASDPASSSVTQAERVEEIYKFSVSEQYLGARERLGINIG